MNTVINGTTIRSNNNGIILTRGRRELYLLGTSVEQTNKAHKAIATHSFDRLYKMAKTTPHMRNSRYIAIPA